MLPHWGSVPFEGPTSSLFLIQLQRRHLLQLRLEFALVMPHAARSCDFVSSAAFSVVHHSTEDTFAPPVPSHLGLTVIRVPHRPSRPSSTESPGQTDLLFVRMTEEQSYQLRFSPLLECLQGTYPVVAFLSHKLFPTLAIVIWIPLLVATGFESSGRSENLFLLSNIASVSMVPSGFLPNGTMLKFMQSILPTGNGSKCCQLCLRDTAFKPVFFSYF